MITESRGNAEDKKLKIYFRRLMASGFASVAAEQLQSLLTSNEVKISGKEKNISGLQLADLIAHPSRGEILDEGGLLGRPLAPYAARIVAALAGKYHRRAGQLTGNTLSAIKKETLAGLFFRRLCDPPPSAKRIKAIIVAPTRLVNPLGAPFQGYRIWILVNWDRMLMR